MFLFGQACRNIKCNSTWIFRKSGVLLGKQTAENSAEYEKTPISQLS
jgi:hypothetical protein